MGADRASNQTVYKYIWIHADTEGKQAGVGGIRTDHREGLLGLFRLIWEADGPFSPQTRCSTWREYQTLSQGGGVWEFLGSLGRWGLTQRQPNQGGRPHRSAAEIYIPPMPGQAKVHGQQSDCFGWVGVHGESVSRLERDLACLSHWRPVGAWAVWLKNRPKVFKLSDSDHKIPRRLATVIVAKLFEYRPWCGRMQRLIRCFYSKMRFEIVHFSKSWILKQCS